MSIVGKVFSRVLLTRLQALADRVYPESQCGFLAGRSTTDMIFTERQLQEKTREQGKRLYLAFIDLTKAFDLVSRKGLFLSSSLWLFPNMKACGASCPLMGLLQTLSRREQSETGLCLSPDTLWNLLLVPLVLCLWLFHWWCVPSYPYRR